MKSIMLSEISQTEKIDIDQAHSSVSYTNKPCSRTIPKGNRNDEGEVQLQQITITMKIIVGSDNYGQELASERK